MIPSDHIVYTKTKTQNETQAEFSISQSSSQAARSAGRQKKKKKNRKNPTSEKQQCSLSYYTRQLEIFRKENQNGGEDEKLHNLLSFASFHPQPNTKKEETSINYNQTTKTKIFACKGGTSYRSAEVRVTQKPKITEIQAQIN